MGMSFAFALVTDDDRKTTDPCRIRGTSHHQRRTCWSEPTTQHTHRQPSPFEGASTEESRDRDGGSTCVCVTLETTTRQVKQSTAQTSSVHSLPLTVIPANAGLRHNTDTTHTRHTDTDTRGRERDTHSHIHTHARTVGVWCSCVSLGFCISLTLSLVHSVPDLDPLVSCVSLSRQVIPGDECVKSSLFSFLPFFAQKERNHDGYRHVMSSCSLVSCLSFPSLTRETCARHPCAAC